MHSAPFSLDLCRAQGVESTGLSEGGAMKFNSRALGLTVGVVWAGTIFLVTLWVLVRGGGGQLRHLQGLYPGYSVSLVGSLIGLVYGFATGLIWGWGFGWLYNRLSSYLSPERPPGS